MSFQLNVMHDIVYGPMGQKHGIRKSFAEGKVRNPNFLYENV